MQSHAVKKNQLNDPNPVSDAPGGADLPKIVVCVDESASSPKVIPYAQAVADALGAEVMLIRVIETQQSASVPFDPVEWDIRRRRAHLHISRLASKHACQGRTIATRILEGRFAEQVCACVSGRPDDITALCRKGGEAKGHVSATLHHILASGPGSILLVPETVAETRVAKFARVFVPLDGSSRAESSVPVAMKIARAQGAEIVLVHATPEPVLTHAGPLEPEDIALRDRLRRRNERVVREYLEGVRARIRANGLTVCTRVLKGGDVRRLLSEAIAADRDTLVVMTSHGVSGHGDVPSGDVAGFLLTRSAAPVLMIETQRDRANTHIFSEAESKGVRRPAGGI